MLKIGLIKEGKIPPDTRVPLIPEQVTDLLEKYDNLEVIIQRSANRSYSDKEYEKLGLKLADDMSDCDILFGVKEVPVDMLIPGKTYFFFSHTIKKQAYNKKLLHEVLKRKIRLIDYETLTDENGLRIIGFGRYAGIVGAHYALLIWGKRKGLYDIKKAVDCKDYYEMTAQYKNLDLGNFKAVITGGGRVAHGAEEVMKAAGIKFAPPGDFLNKSFNEAVYTRFDVDLMYKHKTNKPFEFDHFFNYPSEYDSIFSSYLESANVLINCIYWDPSAPRLFGKHDVRNNNFNVEVISDISCDIDGSVPITTRATTIADPVYGFDPARMEECEPYRNESIDMMTVDNLPNELPRDASKMFGDVIMNNIIPLYIEDPQHDILSRATIAENGSLTPQFNYLEDFVNGK